MINTCFRTIQFRNRISYRGANMSNIESISKNINKWGMLKMIIWSECGNDVFYDRLIKKYGTTDTGLIYRKLVKKASIKPIARNGKPCRLIAYVVGRNATVLETAEVSTYGDILSIIGSHANLEEVGVAYNQIIARRLNYPCIFYSVLHQSLTKSAKQKFEDMAYKGKISISDLPKYTYGIGEKMVEVLK